MTALLKAGIQLLLDVFPDGIAVGTINKHALDRGIVNQLRLLAHISVPLGKVDLHIGDLFHLFLIILSHSRFSPFRLDVDSIK